MMDELRKRIKKAEALRLKPYRDTEGYLTIGYGRCLDIKGISKDEAEMMLETDLHHASDQYLKLPWAMTKNLNATRRRVIVEMIFNLGLGGVLGFKRMWAAIQAGDFHRGANEMMDSKWARQVRSRADRLADDMREG